MSSHTLLTEPGSSGLSTPSTSTELFHKSSKSASSRFSMVPDIAYEAKQTKLKSASFHQSKRRTLEALPISTLRFSSLGLIGRDKEKNILLSSWKKRERLILISGVSGTGKTALVTKTLSTPVAKKGGLYVSGKFDVNLRDEPYFGIAAACQEICESVLADPGISKAIRTGLMEKVGTENITILSDAIPDLSKIVGDETGMMELGKATMMKQDNKESRARFFYAFRSFLRVVTMNFPHIVIVLDDMQWSDPATLDLLPTLLEDYENPNVTVVGIYRSNEVDEFHPLSRFIREVKEKQEDYGVVEIHVGNMNPSQTNEIIMSLLSVDKPNTTLGLATACYKRCYGNIFSLFVFLEMLQAEGLLEYNIGLFKWNWNEDQILSETAATANVVNLLTQKMQRLPSSIQQRLSIAACLGFSFEPSVLETVWKTICLQQELRGQEGQIEDTSSSEMMSDDIHLLLSLGTEEGLLEKGKGENVYRWIHDKVQEAAMLLVPSEKFPGLKVQVAKILVQELDDKTELASYIFIVVNLFHEGGIPVEEAEQLQLAKLSLQASVKAGSLLAYESADRYARIGLQALPTGSWSKEFRLTLNLYSAAAEAAGFLGNTEQLEKCYDEVLGQNNCTLPDKLPVYHAMVSYLAGALGTQNDAIDLILKILAQFGTKFPKRKGPRLIATVLGLLKAKKQISAICPEDIKTMPKVEDKMQLEQIRLMDELFITAYLAQNDDVLPLSVLASTQLTLQNGICEYSSSVFACLGLLFVSAFGDFALAKKSGDCAQAVLAAFPGRTMEARTIMYLNCTVYCWTEPLAKTTAPLLRAYETALSVGDNENATWSITQYIVICFQCGNKSLQTIEADCTIYLKQMKDFSRETVHADISIWRGMVQNLIMGRSDEGLTDLKSEEQFLVNKDKTVLCVYVSCRLFLCMHFGEFEKGAKIALERGNACSKDLPAHVSIMAETFARGMCLYAMARINKKKRAYLKHARRAHKTIKGWVKNGNPNVQHHDMLFNAEEAALKGKLDAAEEFYRTAIKIATRRGHVHESALASERYGNFLVYHRNNREEAKYKYSDAIARYEDWGAAKKAGMLRDMMNANAGIQGMNSSQQEGKLEAQEALYLNLYT